MIIFFHKFGFNGFSFQALHASESIVEGEEEQAIENGKLADLAVNGNDERHSAECNGGDVPKESESAEQNESQETPEGARARVAVKSRRKRVISVNPEFMEVIKQLTIADYVFDFIESFFTNGEVIY